jgi:hypothetical protein
MLGMLLADDEQDAAAAEPGQGAAAGDVGRGRLGAAGCRGSG